MRIFSVCVALMVTACVQPQPAAPIQQPEPAKPNAFTTRPVFQPSPPVPPREIHQLRNERTLACRSPNALIYLSRPNIRAQLGELNWMTVAQDGECVEWPKSRPVVICVDKEPAPPFVAQYFGPDRHSLCHFIARSALGPKIGETAD